MQLVNLVRSSCD